MDSLLGGVSIDRFDPICAFEICHRLTFVPLVSMRPDEVAQQIGIRPTVRNNWHEHQECPSPRNSEPHDSNSNHTHVPMPWWVIRSLSRSSLENVSDLFTNSSLDSFSLKTQRHKLLKLQNNCHNKLNFFNKIIIFFFKLEKFSNVGLRSGEERAGAGVWGTRKCGFWFGGQLHCAHEIIVPIERPNKTESASTAAFRPNDQPKFDPPPNLITSELASTRSSLLRGIVSPI
jgi:hypothetical protein